MRPGVAWQLRRETAPAQRLFAADPLAEPVVRRVTVRTVTGPAVVLGSAQPDAVVNADAAAAAGVRVVRRRSGGGAVWLDADSITWLDVTIPVGDPLWDRDVGRAFWWLGEVWADVLRSLGDGDASVHRGPLLTTAWSSLVCFAGLGAGEVTLPANLLRRVAGKVVGISQRRTRAGALFQCGVLHAWDPAPLLSVLSLTDDERARARIELASAGGTVPRGNVVERFLTALDRR